MFMIIPPPCLIVSGAARRYTTNAPFKFVSMVRFQSFTICAAESPGFYGVDDKDSFPNQCKCNKLQLPLLRYLLSC